MGSQFVVFRSKNRNSNITKLSFANMVLEVGNKIMILSKINNLLETIAKSSYNIILYNLNNNYITTFNTIQ